MIKKDRYGRKFILTNKSKESEGFINVQLKTEDEVHDLYGFYDIAKNMIMPNVYFLSADPVKIEYSIVKYKENNQIFYGLYHLPTKTMEETFAQVDTPSEGWACVKLLNGNWTYMERGLYGILEQQFKSVNEVHEGWAVVETLQGVYKFLNMHTLKLNPQSFANAQSTTHQGFGIVHTFNSNGWTYYHPETQYTFPHALTRPPKNLLEYFMICPEDLDVIPNGCINPSLFAILQKAVYPADKRALLEKETDSKDIC